MSHIYIYGCQISFSPKNDVVISSKDARNYKKPAKLRRYARVYFSRDYIFCRGDRYVLAYICAKNLNLII